MNQGADKIFNKDRLKCTRQCLRRNAPTPEILIWNKLKSKQLCGCKFRRQHSIGNYIVDFYCPSGKLIIEIDGDSHFRKEAIRRDEERTEFFNSLGLQILRFSNKEVMENIEGVMIKIQEEINHPLTPP